MKIKLMFEQQREDSVVSALEIIFKEAMACAMSWVRKRKLESFVCQAEKLPLTSVQKKIPKHFDFRLLTPGQ